MRNYIIAITSCLFLGGVTNATPEKYASGIPTLDAFLAIGTLSKTSKVVGMTGFYGQDQPRQWLILAVNTDTGKLTEYVFTDGIVEGKRNIRRLPNQDLPSIFVNRSRLKVDSDIAFEMVEELASKAGISYDSVHYQLRCRELRKEPVWMVNMLDPGGKSIGIHYISAESGVLLRSIWHPSTRPGGGDGISSAQKPESLLYGGTVTEVSVSTNLGRKKREVKRIIPENVAKE